MPIEVWQEILRYHGAACGTKVDDVLTLNHNFHEIALVTAEYWQNIPLVEDHLDEARIWIDRTRNLPLTFIVHTPMETFADPLRALLAEFAIRCDTIIVRGSPLVLDWLHRNASRFPHMRRLLVDEPTGLPWDWEPSDDLEIVFHGMKIGFDEFPALEVLDLVDMDFVPSPWRYLRHTHLTTLRLHEAIYGYDWEEFLRGLAYLRGLQNLYLQSTREQCFGEPSYDIEYRLVLPELLNLEVDRLGYGRWAPRFLKQLDAINLRELRLSRWGEDIWGEDVWGTLATDPRDSLFPRLERLCMNACLLSSMEDWNAYISPSPALRKFPSVTQVTIIRFFWKLPFLLDEIAPSFPNMEILRVIGSFDLPSLSSFYAQHSRSAAKPCSVELYSASLVGPALRQRDLDAWAKGYDTALIPSIRTFLHDEYTRFLPEDICTPWTYRDDITCGIWSKGPLVEMEMVEKQRLNRLAVEAPEEQGGAK